MDIQKIKYLNFIGNRSQMKEATNESNNNDVLQYTYLNRSMQRKQEDYSLI